MSDFQKEVAERIAAVPANKQLCETAAAFMLASALPKYSYNFSWQGRPIIQYPQDMIAMQELVRRGHALQQLGKQIA
jgi:cephalosporin hydroxylase